MSKLTQKIAAARAARPFADVQVVIDDDLSVRREELAEAIEIAKEKDAKDPRLTASSPEVEALESELAEILEDAATVTVLRFYRLPGRAWSILTSMHPLRLDSPVDRRYGYNYDAVCEAAAQYVEDGKAYGVVIEDEVEYPLTVEEETPKNPEPTNEWADLYDILSGNEIQRIRDAIWELNEYQPAKHVAELVKASGAATRS